METTLAQTTTAETPSTQLKVAETNSVPTPSIPMPQIEPRTAITSLFADGASCDDYNVLDGKFGDGSTFSDPSEFDAMEVTTAGKDMKSFHPTHNAEMKRVFERCYNTFRDICPHMTTDRVTDILEMYAIFQRDEGRKARSTLGDGSEPRLLPLLRISFEHARQYIEELQQLEEAALKQGGSTAKTAATVNEMNGVVRGAVDTIEVRDICRTSDSRNGTNVMVTGAVASRVNVSVVARSRKRKVGDVDNSLRRAGKARKTRGRVSDSEYLSTLHQRRMRAAQELKRRNETPSKEHLGEKGYIECDVCGNVMLRAPKYHKAVNGHIFAWKKVRWCEYADPVVERLRLEAAARTRNTEWSKKSIMKKKLASQRNKDDSIANG